MGQRTQGVTQCRTCKGLGFRTPQLTAAMLTISKLSYFSSIEKNLGKDPCSSILTVIWVYLLIFFLKLSQSKKSRLTAGYIE